MSAYPLRVCNSCDKEFQPSSRHHTCPKCRGKREENYTVCACGNRMQRTSSRCVVCSMDPSLWSGENSRSWKGGRTRHTRGYVLLKAPGHPRAVSNGGYVFEHILVMEERLGRYLLPGENVHHLNGVKDDNRDDNLELWEKTQPTGKRARDALKWAREIIAKYEDIEDKL